MEVRIWFGGIEEVSEFEIEMLIYSTFPVCSVKLLR